MFTDITDTHKDSYNKAVSHPLQSFEWGVFRRETGVIVIRRGIINGKKITSAYTMTLHKVPKTKFTIGYLPKGDLPTPELLEDLKQVGKLHNCVYVQLEPNLLASKKPEMEQLNNIFTLKNSFHPLFTRHTFVLDLKKTEDELLSEMHPKTRYNIRVAIKHNVKIEDVTTKEGFNTFLKLYEETTTRQKFYAHTPSYHHDLFDTLTQVASSKLPEANSLTYKILQATYQDKVLTSWVLFSFHDVLYYPYGASSREHREVMASNLIMWEAIKLGQKMNLSSFDMWGALGENPDPTDPWFGFHKFKQGYGAKLTEYVGSYDYVLDPLKYQGLKVADKARWALLNLKKRIKQ